MIDDAPTPRFSATPTVVTVGFSGAMMMRIREAANRKAIVRNCELASLPTTASESRPFAIIAPLDLVELDRPGFQDLARDVGGMVLELTEEISAKHIGQLLELARSEMDARRERGLIV